MNILVTGTNGFFGNEIIKNLNENNIYSLNRKNSNYDCDLAIKIPILDIYFDLVIHNAGKAHFTPKNKKEENIFNETNIRGTNNLIEGLEKNIPKQFVFISSVAVYGLEKGLQINENYPLKAKDPYGMSKIQAEYLVLEWCKKNNIICTILRLPLLVGKNPPGNLGAMIKAIKKGYYFNIGGGKAKKSMVLAEDVAKFIPIIANIGGVYNLTDGVHPSFYELSHAIDKKKIYNLNLIIAKLIGFLGDFLGEKSPLNSLKIKKITSELTFDDSKARKLGWKPKKILDYLKENEL